MIYTIAIPTHNDFDTIKRCIDSALKIEFEDYEIVISDTSTDDDTWLYLNQLKTDKNIRIFRNDSNWDLWTNHNFCLSKADGQYTVFIHTDDYLLEDCLKTYDKHLKKLNYPKRIIMSGRSLYGDFFSSCDRTIHELETVISGTDALGIMISGGLAPSGMLISTCFNEIGGYLEDYLIPPHSDCISLINAIFNGFSMYFMREIVFIRCTNGSTFKKITNEDIKTMNCLLHQYFTDDQLKIIINKIFETRKMILLKFLKNDILFKKYIKKRMIQMCLLHPLLVLRSIIVRIIRKMR